MHELFFFKYLETKLMSKIKIQVSLLSLLSNRNASNYRVDTAIREIQIKRKQLFIVLENKRSVVIGSQDDNDVDKHNNKYVYTKIIEINLVWNYVVLN